MLRKAMYGVVALAAFLSAFMLSSPSAEASWYVRTSTQKESLYQWLQEQGYEVKNPAPASTRTLTPQPSTSPGRRTSPNAATEPQPNPAPSSINRVNSLEQRMFQLVNQERAKAGLPPFILDAQLSQLARMKSQDIVDNGYFSHTSPTYGTPDQMLRNAGVRARVMGAENLAKQKNVDWAHAMLMASSGHRSNILHPEHDRIGIGVVPSGSGVVVTQLFTGK